MRIRGFTLTQAVVGMVAAGALVSAVWGGLAWHAGVHFARGEASTLAKWEAANREAAAAQRARELDVSDAIKEKEAQRLAAAARADENDRKWKEAVREANRNKVALGVCPEPEPVAVGDGGNAGTGLHPPAVADGGTRAPAGAGLRVTWQFVHDFDTAWTGLDGEPVFRAAAGGEGAERAGASPYALEEVRDVHGENARRCSRDRREFESLIQKIKAAEAAYERDRR